MKPKSKLTLETKEQADGTVRLAGGKALFTPPVGKAYWKFRVQVSKKQAVIGFPKFCTIGIGFQHEKDWNTNLPFTSPAKEIYDHIHVNGCGAVPSTCIEAIKMIQAAAAKLLPEQARRCRAR